MVLDLLWHVVRENSFLSTQNLALLITVASLLADMDKMQMKERLHMDKMNEQLGRLWKENWCLLQDRLVPIYISDGRSNVCTVKSTNECVVIIYSKNQCTYSKKYK
jgi:hypothetical protein